MTNSNSWDHQIVALPYNHNFGGERLRCTAGRVAAKRLKEWHRSQRKSTALLREISRVAA